MRRKITKITNEEEYNRIIRNIDKEIKYELKKGLLYRKKPEKGLRVIKRYEFEGLMYLLDRKSVV